MRQLILIVAILISGFSVVALSNDIQSMNSINVLVIEGFTEVSLNELPTVITDAVKKNYTDTTLTKAYVNENNQYKLELKLEEVSNVVFIDKDGKWLKETDIKKVEKK